MNASVGLETGAEKFESPVEDDGVDDNDSVKDVAVERYLSGSFGGAADGLEAADMLHTFTPGLYGSSETESVVKLSEDEVAKIASHTSTSLANLIEAREAVQGLSENEAPLRAPSKTLIQSHASSGAGGNKQEAKLRTGTSQLFDFVAEGLDATDAKSGSALDTVGEGSDSGREEEQAKTDDGIWLSKQPSERINAEDDSDNGEAVRKPAENIENSQTAKVDMETTTPHRPSAEDETHDREDEGINNIWLDLFKDLKFGSAVQKGKLIGRDRAFHQTSNKMNVGCHIEKGDAESRWGYCRILFSDWFDTFLNYGTNYILAVIIVVYTVFLFIFAIFYFIIFQTCETTQAMSFAASFAFSLQTATTTGYTLPQSNDVMFFNGCPSWIIVIYIQCIFYLLFNGVVIGTMMLRYSRADRRSNQIIFSKNACVVCIRGRFYLTFQCFDLQASQPIIGATVRIFAILHEVDQKAKALWQMRAMRLIRPDDELGAKLWLSVPSICIHEIDAWSPLAPSELTRPPKASQTAAPNRFPQPPQRAVDGRAGSRGQTTCSVCGASFLTEAALRRHIIYSKQDERSRNRPETFGHLRVNVRHFSRPVVSRLPPPEEDLESDNEHDEPYIQKENEENEDELIKPDMIRAQLPFKVSEPIEVRDAIKSRMEDRKIEIVCLIEGTDPHSANTFQARHSYGPADIVYDAQHAPCMGIGKDGCAEINLSFFHEVKIYTKGVNIENPDAFASHV